MPHAKMTTYFNLITQQHPCLTSHVCDLQKAVNNVLDEAVLVALEHLDPKEMEKCVLL